MQFLRRGDICLTGAAPPTAAAATSGEWGEYGFVEARQEVSSDGIITSFHAKRSSANSADREKSLEQAIMYSREYYPWRLFSDQNEAFISVGFREQLYFSTK